MIALAAATMVAALCATGGAALAAFPNFSDCPIASEGICLDVQSQSGEIIIKGFRVPLDHSLEIRGALRNETFIPPSGSNGFIAQPVNVPGGVLGIELPISLNLVTATAELAGPASSIQFEPGRGDISMPIKLHLSNPLIGSSCYIGSNSHPVRVNLITGSTNPPPPNRPISGHVGTGSFEPPNVVIASGNLNVDNAFAIPSASGCGLLGILNPLINLKLGLPSAAGNNTLTVANDVAIKIYN